MNQVSHPFHHPGVGGRGLADKQGARLHGALRLRHSFHVANESCSDEQFRKIKVQNSREHTHGLEAQAAVSIALSTMIDIRERNVKHAIMVHENQL